MGGAVAKIFTKLEGPTKMELVVIGKSENAAQLMFIGFNDVSKIIFVGYIACLESFEIGKIERKAANERSVDKTESDVAFYIYVRKLA